jgi:hypothetical protein
MASQKIICSSEQLYKYLSEKVEFFREEVKVKVEDGELQMDGFRCFLCEHQQPFETVVSVKKVRELRKLLSCIHDQPIVLHIGYDNFAIHYIQI